MSKRVFAVVFPSVITIMIVVIYGVSVPFWSDGTAPADPTLIVSLVAMVLAILALGSGAIYFLLRNEIHTRLMNEIRQRDVLLIQIRTRLVQAEIHHQFYEQAWEQADHTSKIYMNDVWFRHHLELAKRNSGEAWVDSRKLDGHDEAATYARLKALNDYTYHLASYCHFQSEDISEMNRLSERLKDLKTVSTNSPNANSGVEETILWASLICGDQEKRKQWKRLLPQNVVTLQDSMLTEKYERLFGLGTEQKETATSIPDS